MLTVHNVDFGLPTPVEDVEGCDTAVLITVSARDVKEGSSNTYFYRRPQLNEVIPPGASISVVDPTSLLDVITKVNSVYGTTIDPERVGDFIYDEPDHQVWFSMMDNSLL